MQSAAYKSVPLRIFNKPPDGVKRRGSSGYMPLRLKSTLREHKIPIKTWGAALVQESGRYAGEAFSGAAANQIINWGLMPKNTSLESLKAQTAAFLRKHGVPEAEIKDAWKVIQQDELVAIKPRGGTRGADPKVFPEIEPEEDQLPELQMLSQQARKHFKLFRDPFRDDVQGPEDVFLSTEQQYIRESMFQAAKHGGFLAVIGESGAGKTTLRRDLLTRIEQNNEPITVIQPRIIDKRKMSAGAICDAIIRDISSEPPKQSLEAKARQIERLLTGSSRAGNTHVLIIEEAHDITIYVLKLLKRFWELEDGFRKLLAIILIGQTELSSLLDERQNWEAREVIRRCEIAVLQPLNGDMEDYLRLKFKRVSMQLSDIFESDAFDAIRERLTIQRRGSSQTISMHYPLVVNAVVIKALNLAAELGAAKISADIVREV